MSKLKYIHSDNNTAFCGSSCLDDEQILRLKDALKEIESKLKVKPKTITISGEAHNIIKNHCATLNESIGEWSERKLLESVSKLSYGIEEYYIKPGYIAAGLYTNLGFTSSVK